MGMASSENESKSTTHDGRVQRSVRSREAIVTAVLELIAEGDRVPTAERVAERAGVGIRTVFRHFSDMDSLYATMSECVKERVLEYLSEDPIGGSLKERVNRFIDLRGAAVDAISPFFRSSAVLRWRSEFLETEYRRNLKGQRERLLVFFPELKGAPPDLFEAVDTAASPETWIRLRIEQKLSFPRAKAAQARLLMGVLAEIID